MDTMVDALCALGAQGKCPVSKIRQLVHAREPGQVLEALTAELSCDDWECGRKRARALGMLDIQTVAPWDFPNGLKALKWPPLCLFVRGPAAVLYSEGESVVGSRKASVGPAWWARQRAAIAVSDNQTVISGGALGIDGEAHRAAWRAGGISVVVLGVAVDRTYPAANKSLFAEIVRQGGAIVSEHAPLTPTYGSHHATRNRIIAALSRRLWIAEAGRDSGTLHTARAAMQLGLPIGVPPREVGGCREGIEWLLQESQSVHVVGPIPV